MDAMEGISAQKAKAKLEYICARREITFSKAIELMQRWRVSQKEQQEVLEALVKQGYIDERRYARAFVREKQRSGKWGRRKVVEALRIKRIPMDVIEEAMNEEWRENEESLERILKDKARGLKAKDDYDRRNKLIRFGLSRGFDFESIEIAIKKI